MQDLKGKQALLVDLRGQLHSGRLSPGQKLQATGAFAERYNIALPTAHAALRQLVDEGLLLRETGRGTFVSPTVKTDVQVGLGLLMRARGHIWGDLASRLVSSMQALGADVRLVDVSDREETNEWEGRVASVFEIDPRAVVVDSVGTALELMPQHPDCHFISLRDGPGDTFAGDIVAPNEYLAAFEATRHLLSHGHERVAYYTPQFEPGSGGHDEADRHRGRDGYQDALAQAGINYSGVYTCVPGKEGDDTIRTMLSRRDRPTALYCAHDHRAIEVKTVAAEMSLHVPDDLAIVSCGNTPWADAHDFSSMDLRYDLVGTVLLEFVADLMADSRETDHWIQHRIQPSLVVRNSCGGHTSASSVNPRVDDGKLDRVWLPQFQE